MGRKQKRLWKYILLFPAACLILVNMIVGCQMSVEHPDLSGRQDPPGDLLGTTLAKDTAANLALLEALILDQADASLENGEIAEALEYVALAISCCNEQYSGRALEIVGMSLVHPNYRLDNYGHADNCLRRCEAATPSSGDGAITACWVTALSELLAKETENQTLRDTIGSQKRRIQTLKKQISQLKAVDLELVQPESAIEVP
ncbi:MAG: hypothetical protein GY799_16680 [Desulfobulbaceae bacterium]|nr:hypothetical protein [Desulfobulbaceae bacterium]